MSTLLAFTTDAKLATGLDVYRRIDAALCNNACNDNVVV